MDIRQAIQAAAQDPQFQQVLQAAQAELFNVPLEMVDELIQLLEAALENPADYAQIRQAAIADDMVDPEDLPEQFDGTALAAVLVVLYKLREGGGPQAAMARGGLAQMRTMSAQGRELAKYGRMGDTMVAHITPQEAALLKSLGGSGTINPVTGLPEFGFWKSLKKVFKAVAPIAINFIAPGLGTAIGSALGASGAAAAALGGAVLGGATSALTGGNVLKGALFGGLGGGLGEMVGGAANSALGLNLGSAGQGVLGGALVGGLGGALSGQGFAQGALSGAAGSALGNFTQNLGVPGPLGAGLSAAGRDAGRMITAGFDPRTAIASGALSGLATGLTYKPSQAAVAEMRDTPGGLGKLNTEFKPGETAINPETGEVYLPAGGAQAPGGALSKLIPGMGGGAQGSNPFSLKNIGTLAMLGNALSPQQQQMQQQATQALSPQQQEYFNRPGIAWDWDKLQQDAQAQGMDVGQYVASYWPQVTSGQYNVAQQQQPAAMAMGGGYAGGGGPLSAAARLVRGGGSGRDDTINARLSDGEYVMDAETVAMIGDGSTDEGARRLDVMRSQLRKHKGKALAKGKFSPNAKSPLAYLKGAA